MDPLHVQLMAAGSFFIEKMEISGSMHQNFTEHRFKMENFAEKIQFIFEKSDFLNTLTYCLSRQNELALNVCEPTHNQSDPETNFQINSVGG